VAAGARVRPNPSLKPNPNDHAPGRRQRAVASSSRRARHAPVASGLARTLGHAGITASTSRPPESEDQMHQGFCHCGAVKLTLPSTPTVATDCNCSLCRRIGGPWVYFEFGTVQIEGHPENTAEYIQGDRTLRTIHCRTCGCTTHWEPLDPKANSKHGVNLGNFDPQLIAAVRVRKFDGASTWKFFDELPQANESTP